MSFRTGYWGCLRLPAEETPIHYKEVSRTHLEVSRGSHPCEPEPEPEPSKLVAGSALALCPGVGLGGRHWGSLHLLSH